MKINIFPGDLTDISAKKVLQRNIVITDLARKLNILDMQVSGWVGYNLVNRCSSLCILH